MKDIGKHKIDKAMVSKIVAITLTLSTYTTYAQPMKDLNPKQEVHMSFGEVIKVAFTNFFSKLSPPIDNQDDLDTEEWKLERETINPTQTLDNQTNPKLRDDIGELKQQFDYDWGMDISEGLEETVEEDGDRGLLEIYEEVSIEEPEELKSNIDKINEKVINSSYERQTFDTLAEQQEKRRLEIIAQEEREKELEELFQQRLDEEVARVKRETESKLEAIRQRELAEQERLRLQNMPRGVITPFNPTTFRNEMELISRAMGREVETAQASQIRNLMPNYLGKPYVWGGDDRTTGGTGYDCSGFTLSVMNTFGKRIPRVSAQQFKSGTAVEVGDLQVGDLVFFDTNKGFRPYVDAPTKVSHVGLYIGKGMMVHASSGSNRIRTEKVFGSYFAPRYMGARRY